MTFLSEVRQRVESVYDTDNPLENEPMAIVGSIYVQDVSVLLRVFDDLKHAFLDEEGQIRPDHEENLVKLFQRAETPNPIGPPSVPRKPTPRDVDSLILWDKAHHRS